tara:strand:- start:503 stop:829 length:327 start_codon:yes stop_codon:yes gene_type:complete
MITYTYNIKIANIIPYNIESQQRDIIRSISWTLTGTKDGKSATQGGAMDFEVENGVTDSFIEITSLSSSDLQSWVETRVGTTRLNEMKSEIEASIDAQPDDFNIIPDA